MISTEGFFELFGDDREIVVDLLGEHGERVATVLSPVFENLYVYPARMTVTSMEFASKALAKATGEPVNDIELVSLDRANCLGLAGYFENAMSVRFGVRLKISTDPKVAPLSGMVFDAIDRHLAKAGKGRDRDLRHRMVQGLHAFTMAVSGTILLGRDGESVEDMARVIPFWYPAGFLNGGAQKIWRYVIATAT